MLAQGATIKEAAKKVGVNEKSIDNWKHKLHFVEALREAEDAIYQDSMNLLKRTSKAAIMTLVACMDPKVSNYVRVAAASRLLDASMEVHSAQKLAARIAELEEIIESRIS